MCFKVNSKLNNIHVHRFFTESLRWGPYGSHNPNSRTSITGMSQLLHCKHCVHHRSEITYTQIAWSLSVCPSVRPSVMLSGCLSYLSVSHVDCPSFVRPYICLCYIVRPSVRLSCCLAVCPIFLSVMLCVRHSSVRISVWVALSVRLHVRLSRCNINVCRAP